MKTAIDKKFTTIDGIAKVKSNLEEFKNRYTENDLVRMFNDAFNESVSGDVLRCTVTGFETCGYDSKTSFHISMLVFNRFFEVCEIGYYTDINGNVNVDTLLKQLEIYKHI